MRVVVLHYIPTQVRQWREEVHVEVIKKGEGNCMHESLDYQTGSYYRASPACTLILRVARAFRVPIIVIKEQILWRDSCL